MSACDLSFEIEQRELRPGDTIRAVLVIHANRKVKADAVSVGLSWRTHGKGNRDSEIVEKLELGAIELAAGEERRENITMTAPRGPVSYHGMIVNVDWYLSARADVAWAIDPKTEAELLLLPAPPEEIAGYRTLPERRARTHVLGTGTPRRTPPESALLALLAFVFLGFAIVFSDGGPEVIGSVIVMGMTGFLAWRALKPRFAKARLGDVTVSLSPEHTQAGGTVQLELRLCPPQPVTLNGVSARLLAEEIAVSGSGTSKTTARHMLYSDTATIGQRRRIAARESVVLEGSLELPRSAEPSFEASNNKVRWTVVTEIDIEAWPDLQDERVLTVHPS
jgi:hypothetical protein